MSLADFRRQFKRPPPHLYLGIVLMKILDAHTTLCSQLFFHEGNDYVLHFDKAAQESSNSFSYVTRLFQCC